MMKLGLGTVQFGMDYGISNREGKTQLAEIRRILAAAARSGIDLLDTASLYGESEEALGKALEGVPTFRIATKTPRFPSGYGSAEASVMEAAFAASLKKIRMESVYALLAHGAEDLLGRGGDRFMDSMLKMKSDGKAAKIGASVYSGSQIEALLERYPIDIIQAPVNVLDRRLITGGQLQSLKRAGVEFHARSVFLQGLLLMDPESAPSYFEPIRPLLRSFRKAAIDSGATPLQAALAFVSRIGEVDYAVVGVANLAQLEEILGGIRYGGLPDYSGFFCDQAEFLDPSQWKVPC